MKNKLNEMEQMNNANSSLAESFEVDFLNMKGSDIKKAMSQIDNFVFRSSGTMGDEKVYFEGEREDGTKLLIITIEKGDNYKTPVEKAKAIEEEERKKQEAENKD